MTVGPALRLSECPRFAFGLPLEDIFPEGHIHPIFEDVLTSAYNALIASNYSLDVVLNKLKGPVEKRLKLKEKLVKATNKIDFDNLEYPGALFWLIRHFLGLLPIQLLPYFTNGQYFNWKDLSVNCKKFIVTSECSESKQFVCKCSREIANLPNVHVLLLQRLIKFCRKIISSPLYDGEHLRKKTASSIVKYLCGAIFLRPYEPGNRKENEKHYQPLLLYLIVKWPLLDKYSNKYRLEKCLTIMQRINENEESFNDSYLTEKNLSFDQNSQVITKIEILSDKEELYESEKARNNAKNEEESNEINNTKSQNNLTSFKSNTKIVEQSNNKIIEENKICESNSKIIEENDILQDKEDFDKLNQRNNNIEITENHQNIYQNANVIKQELNSNSDLKNNSIYNKTNGIKIEPDSEVELDNIDKRSEYSELVQIYDYNIETENILDIPVLRLVPYVYYYDTDKYLKDISCQTDCNKTQENERNLTETFENVNQNELEQNYNFNVDLNQSYTQYDCLRNSSRRFKDDFENIEDKYWRITQKNSRDLIENEQNLSENYQTDERFEQNNSNFLQYNENECSFRQKVNKKSYRNYINKLRGKKSKKNLNSLEQDQRQTEMKKGVYGWVYSLTSDVSESEPEKLSKNDDLDSRSFIFEECDDSCKSEQGENQASVMNRVLKIGWTYSPKDINNKKSSHKSKNPFDNTLSSSKLFEEDSNQSKTQLFASSSKCNVKNSSSKKRLSLSSIGSKVATKLDLKKLFSSSKRESLENSVSENEISKVKYNKIDSIKSSMF